MIDSQRDFIKGLVSVIIPVYNAEKYISGTIESALKQSYTNIEIILVDDRSDDSSGDIIKKYQTSDNRIVYHLQEKNMGAGYARNKALELAKGQYVAFLDSDDLWKPKKLELQIELMKKTGLPFSYAAIDMIDGANKRIKEKRHVKTRINYDFLLSNTMIATSSVVIDRCVLGDFRMHLRRGGQDYATWLRLLRGGTVACGINRVLVHYRVSGNSLSSNKLDSIRQIWEIQTCDEGINKVKVALNIFRWCCNSVKKYFL